MYYEKLKNNPFKTKNDLQQALVDLLDPLFKFKLKSSTGFDIGDTGSHFIKKSSLLESFSRPLWGIIPLIAGGFKFNKLKYYHIGIKIGANPKEQDYWGSGIKSPQNFVEMAPIGFGLAYLPEIFWEQLDGDAKKNLSKWLNDIKHVKYTSNWLFFIVLVELGLKQIGSNYYDESILFSALDRIDKLYSGDGWYNNTDKINGNPFKQYDYYNSFAFHYYGLIYSVIAEKSDYNRASIFKERAIRFSKDYKYWFDSKGGTIPYGRSLTYQFVQSAFWSALVFANVEALPWGEIKGFILQNLRWWFSKPIFSETGLMQIGYTYPNLKMSEEYNSPASPYWALKSFLLLAVSDDHPFWASKELPIKNKKDISVQKKPCMIICYDKISKHLFSLNGGQNTNYFPSNTAEKYSKFAYSSSFGFNVSAGNGHYEHVACDNMLILSDDCDFWRYRKKTNSKIADNNVIVSEWNPWKDVNIITVIIPLLPWHIRIHLIKTKRELNYIEGGFAVPDTEKEEPIIIDRKVNKNWAFIKSDSSISIIMDLDLFAKTDKIKLIANTNISYPRTIVPVLKGKILKGKRRLISLVFAAPELIDINMIYNKIPDIKTIKNLIPKELNYRYYKPNLNIKKYLLKLINN